jgi:hypothetical protein
MHKPPETLPPTDLTADWVILAVGILLTVAGFRLLEAAAAEWRMVGLILLLWGVSAGIRVLAVFIRALSHSNKDRRTK